MKLKKIVLVVFLFISEILLFSQSKVTAPLEVENYRGMRVQKTGEELYVNYIKALNIDNKKIQIDILFNEGINPKSVNSNNFSINGKSISPETEFTFNKNGDTVRFSVEKSDKLKLTIKNVESYSGQKIQEYSAEIKIQ